MNFVKPKKHLGQHFLNDENISSKIVESLSNVENVLEIGPGMGVLSKHLIEKCKYLKVIEIDKESVIYLSKNYPYLEIIEGDCLKENFNLIFSEKFSVIGNFPYNISTQIIFKAIENKEKICELVGMFQKEVAERIASKEGSKMYGITSVLTQAFYNVEYLFSVDENSFIPPPKVKSGVIKLKRKDEIIDFDEKKLFTIVKMAFNQRRKTLRNSIKSLITNLSPKYDYLLQKRPEQLSVKEFINLTKVISK